MKELEHIKEDRICCDSKVCFKKKSFYPALVILTILVDLATMVSFAIVVYLYYVRYIYKLQDSDPKKAELVGRYLTRLLLVCWVNYIGFFLKLFYGFRWLCTKKLSRNNFIAYYRLVWTNGVWNFLFNLTIVLCNIDDATFPGMILSQEISMVFVSLQLTFVEIYMRYIDEMHIVKNDIRRDQQILLKHFFLSSDQSHYSSNSL